MERIGIYGGTFNPPHLGHIGAAQEAMAELRLDRMLLMPAFQSPDKEKPKIDPKHRLQMLRLAAAPGMEVSDIEISRGGVSYTVQTLEQLHKEHPEAELVLCMGSDMFLNLQSWKEHGRILELAEIAVFQRGDKDEQVGIARQKQHLEADGARITAVANPVLTIASSNLRRLLAFGCGESFLHPDVYAYIQENGLYQTRKDWKNLPMEQLEKVVISLLKPQRVRHVLGCRDTAAELARIWGADETDAARAGMLHDVTKALDGPLQLTLCGAYDIMLDEFSSKNPKTLHALTGSLVADRIFGENKAVVDAICSHTTGKGNMNTLEKIIYVADYMEPNRDFPGVEELRYLAHTNLDKALKLGLEMTLAVLHERGSDISPESAEALRYLESHGV